MRNRILEAALDCMRETGVRGTTTRSIARRAGVAEGSIYNHFTNRSELIVDAFALATHDIRAHVAALQQRVGTHTVEDNLVSLMEAVIEFFEEIFPIVGSILGDPQLRSWFTDGTVASPQGEPLTPLTGVVELGKYLEAEHDQGRLAGNRCWTTCASLLIGACLHYVYLQMLSPQGIAGVTAQSGQSPRTYAREATRTLFEI